MYGRRRFGLKTILFLFLILVGSVYWVIDATLSDAVSEVARSVAQLEGQKVIMQAVNSKIGSRVEYENIIAVQKDEQGRVVLLQPKTVMINRLMSQTVLAVQEDLADLGKKDFKVPLGQVLGSRIFAAFGPELGIRIMPVGKVNVDLIDRFEGAGVNQTRHLIYLKISTNIRIAAPLSYGEETVAVTMPVAESIIVGQVPGTYVNVSNDFGSALVAKLGLITDSKNGVAVNH